MMGVQYLRSHPEITAVFCANDAVAVALLQASRQAGISIPDQVSVVGFDDIDLAGFVSPALTTMAVDKVGMGRIAVALLAYRLEFGKEFVTQTLVRSPAREAPIRSPSRGPAAWQHGRQRAPRRPSTGLNERTPMQP